VEVPAAEPLSVPAEVLREVPDALVPSRFVPAEVALLPVEVPPVTTRPDAAGRSLIPEEPSNPPMPADPLEPLEYPLGSEPRVPPAARVEPNSLLVSGIGATSW